MTGKCLCGAVTFVADGVEAKHSACHCGMCRRWSNSAFMGVRTKTVTFTGEDHIGRYTSSDWAERGFCKQCGTALFYFFKPVQGYVMSAGAFDDPSSFELNLEIFHDRKPPGYAFAGDHPRWTEAETFANYAPKK